MKEEKEGGNDAQNTVNFKERPSAKICLLPIPSESFWPKIGSLRLPTHTRDTDTYFS